jgi:hypothetical protein
MSDFVEESFVNHLGQTINPGDKVVYVGKSYGSTYVNTGVFAGVRKATRRISKYLRDENNQYIKEEYEAHGRKYTRYKMETTESYQPIAVTVRNVPTDRWGYVNGNYQKLEGEHFRVATLPLMRVYKLA